MFYTGIDKKDLHCIGGGNLDFLPSDLRIDDGLLGFETDGFWALGGVFCSVCR